ncbi:MAG TPA: alpha/beta fold hydrolase [Candidatus Tumulicola sp.]|jgi:pimeloyl-ACP methyl ester carboxylesterase
MIRLANRIAAALALAIFSSLAVPAMAATLPPAPTPSASFDSGMLHVDKYGSGPQSMVLIPGLASGPWSWYGTIDHFSKYFTVYSVTLAGFDGTPAPAQTPTFEAFANDFWQMLSAHGITSPVVVGHSLGGTLAIYLAEQHPERLRAIVAADGLPIFPLLFRTSTADRTTQANALAKPYSAMTQAQALDYETKYMQNIGTLDPELVAPTAKLEASSDPKTVGAWLKADLIADLRPDLSKIRIPMLEIMPYDPQMSAKAGFSQEQSLAFYKSLLDGAPQATVIAIGPSRHFVMLDRPDAFYTAVHQFISGLPAAAANGPSPSGL